MKKFLLILIALIATTDAVEWDVEEIPPDPGCFNAAPLITLDNHAQPRILFVKVNFSTMRFDIQTASKTAGSWDIEDVATFLEMYDCYYNFDVDQDGNTYVVFSDLPDMDAYHYDIFLATDRTGEFVIQNLTEGDTNWEYIPVVQVDRSGTVHVLYYQETEEELLLIYGWLDGEIFNQKVVTSNVSGNDYHSIDLILDQNDTPHAFYFDGDNNYIWHATPENEPEENWLFEQINDIESYEVTAAIDQSGYLHLAYDFDYEPLYYLTNKSGSWIEETVADGSTGGNEEPSIAIDPQGNPHIAWLRTNQDYWYDICFGTKTDGGWSEELITDTPSDDEMPGVGHFFAIDDSGYGHLVYAFMDELEEEILMYYAKTAEPLSSGIAEIPSERNPMSLEVHGTSVEFYLPNAGNVKLDLYDAAGRRVQHIASGIYESGEHVVPINTSELSSGVYFARIKVGNQSTSVKLAVTR